MSTELPGEHRDLPRRDALDVPPAGCERSLDFFADPDPLVFAARLPIFVTVTPLVCLLLPVLFGAVYGPALAVLFVPTAYLILLARHVPHEHRLTVTLVGYAAVVFLLWFAL